jgi:hypothetical protein
MGKEKNAQREGLAPSLSSQNDGFKGEIVGFETL